MFGRWNEHSHVCCLTPNLLQSNFAFWNPRCLACGISHSYTGDIMWRLRNPMRFDGFQARESWLSPTGFGGLHLKIVRNIFRGLVFEASFVLIFCWLCCLHHPSFREKEPVWLSQVTSLSSRDYMKWLPFVIEQVLWKPWPMSFDHLPISTVASVLGKPLDLPEGRRVCDITTPLIDDFPTLLR